MIKQHKNKMGTKDNKQTQVENGSVILTCQLLKAKQWKQFGCKRIWTLQLDTFIWQQPELILEAFCLFDTWHQIKGAIFCCQSHQITCRWFCEDESLYWITQRRESFDKSTHTPNKCNNLCHDNINHFITYSCGRVEVNSTY